MRKAVVLPALALAGAVGASVAIRRRTLQQWANTPDPLGGRPPRFPAGESTTVTTDDGAQIYTRRTGDGPSVVLVHGLTSNHDDWGPVAERLVADGFEVVAVDQRGHGGSTVGRDGFGVERQAADLAQALVALDVQDAVLVGHSMGGMAAMGLAVHDPEVLRDRIAGLTIVASAASIKEQQDQVRYRVGDNDLARSLARRPELFTMATGRFVLGEQPSLALVRYCLDSYRRCPEQTRIGAGEGLRSLDLVDQLTEIDCPTMVVCGDHDRLTPIHQSEEIAAAIPGARMERIPGAGHMVIWEEVDQLADLVLEFAEQVQAGSRTASGSGG